MDQSTKIKILVFLVIALIGFSLGGLLAAVAPINDSDSAKLVAVEDDNFDAHTIDRVEIITPKIENTTYIDTNNSTTTIDNFTDEMMEIANDTWNDLIGDDNAKEEIP